MTTDTIEQTRTQSTPESAQVRTEDGMTFDALALCEPLHRALRDKKYTHPSPIQAKAIPHLLEGRDLIGLAQTGTGKTAAFALPILHRLNAHPKQAGPNRVRALILTPTRELASQIGQSFEAYGKHLRLRHTVIFGGVGFGKQIETLRRGVDILVATPGRLLDLEQQGHVKFDAVEVFVLDEADRMLDMGFVHDVKRVMAKVPPKRQSLLFSATMPPAIQEIVDRMLDRPVRVEVTPVASTAEKVEQRLCHVDRDNKRHLLVHVLKENPEGLVLVFVRMKHAANRLAEQLVKEGIRADAIHGNKSQNARERALENFRTGRVRVLVATDIAARGIDVKGISLVVNFDLPEEPEAYVHRIGRTARAGAEGLAVSFCDRAERDLLRGIERLIRKSLFVVRDHPFAPAPGTETQAPRPDSSRDSRSFSRGPRRSGGRPQGQGRGRSQGQRSSSSSSQREGGGGHSSSQPQARPSTGGGIGGGVRRFFGFGGNR